MYNIYMSGIRLIIMTPNDSNNKKCEYIYKCIVYQYCIVQYTYDNNNNTNNNNNTTNNNTNNK